MFIAYDPREEQAFGPFDTEGQAQQWAIGYDAWMPDRTYAGTVRWQCIEVAHVGEPNADGDFDYTIFEPDALHCDYCSKVELASDLTPDWNGETGNHLSCEARVESAKTTEKYPVVANGNELNEDIEARTDWTS